jgi:hypothetical protein
MEIEMRGEKGKENWALRYKLEGLGARDFSSGALQVYWGCVVSC